MEEEVSILSPSQQSSTRDSQRRLDPGQLQQDAGSQGAGSGAAGWPAQFYRTLLFAALKRVTSGQIVIVDQDERFAFGRPDTSLTCQIEVLRKRFYRSAIRGGSLGAAESYLRGDWSSDDLVTAMRILAKNQEALTSLGRGWWAYLRRSWQWRQRNTRRGSRRNIAAHYDLSNKFFRLFLDQTMTYSSGIFAAERSTLREASIEKYDTICRKLRLTPGDCVLEIGGGWGGFAVHAAKTYGCHVTTTTISPEQYRFAESRIKEEDLAQQITLLSADYRDLAGQYDKLVSIEMIEAVGHEFLPTYFASCSRLLKPDGMFLLQAILIPDQRYRQYCRSVDFIQRYIFPGGCLPSLGTIVNAVQAETDFRITHLEEFAEHYARTLELWRTAFVEQLDAVRAMGKNDEFIRTWYYYFSYCEAAFRERQIGVAQLLLAKPDCRQSAVLGIERIPEPRSTALA
jgi:cyclopropane-fatty-acyl-phospholipid synthase